MATYIDINGLKEFLNNIVNAPIVENPDYLLGTSGSQITRQTYK